MDRLPHVSLLCQLDLALGSDPIDPAEGLTPAIAAEIAQALEAGLRYNTVFLEAFDAAHARLVYTSGIRALRGTQV